MQPSQQTASLVKRLAGPSTGKAGLAQDQAEINRIIADVSKGSKFYENEKKKDKELTKKIEQILHLRDELTMKSGVDMHKVEATVDQLLQKLESARDLTQTIVHFDLDSFFASVEVLNNPALADKPFAVGHSVISTASYAARKYGVRSGMATFIAKKLCPELIMVDHGFSNYSEMSRKVMAICKRYDPQMCPAGCDEGYLNITAYCVENNIGVDDCVEHLRSAVFSETKLTVSAGIAPNLMLAKICSDKNKPNGQFHLPFESEAIIAFMRELPIRRVPGIGRVSERLLESIGIKTCGDIFTYRATLSLMDKQFGLMHLLRTHLGIADNSVEPPQREERKSIGAERTFAPMGDKQKILDKLEEVCAELESDMEETQWTGRTITLKYKLDTFEVFTRAKSSNRWISKKEDLFAAGQELLLPELPLTIRLIGLRVTKLKDLRGPDPSTGIKRFFDAANSSSPNKKRRLSTSHQATCSDTVSDPGESSDAETAKPTSSRTRKPESKARQPSVEREVHTCPVCEKTVTTDINAHLDSCLSREAIREAQAEGSNPTKQGNLWERWAKQAPSSRKKTGQ
ncbi:IMS-domain-containing protein [Mycena belliarum]|uniref:DNA polymerase kappa n=1 Tax=Mycena belliarum TaxID=1033014 RepID=A0AAD6U478_9AGAR|nr:IMS-domain-containing protein [Mycena belliae]